MAKDFDYISEQTKKDFAAMVQASKTGSPISDFMDEAGVSALNKIVASANGPVASPVVPTVTEIEDGRERGYDLYSLLIKKRIMVLEGQVNERMASIACASLLYMNSDLGGDGKGKEPITMYINSPGGSVMHGLSIYDVMRSIEAPITTIGIGMQASMGSILLAAGDTRKMTRSSKYMIHQPLGGNGQSTQQTDIEINADFIGRLREDLTDIYVRHLGLNHKFWDIVLERDTWLSAEQAKEMGIVSELIVGDRKRTVHEEFSKRAGRGEEIEAQIPTETAEILALINTAKGSRIRPELVVALSKKPEFWTPSRAQQEAEKAAEQTVANDDVQVAKPRTANVKRNP